MPRALWFGRARHATHADPRRKNGAEGPLFPPPHSRPIPLKVWLRELLRQRRVTGTLEESSRPDNSRDRGVFPEKGGVLPPWRDHVGQRVSRVPCRADGGARGTVLWRARVCELPATFSLTVEERTLLDTAGSGVVVAGSRTELGVAGRRRRSAGKRPPDRRMPGSRVGGRGCARQRPLVARGRRARWACRRGRAPGVGRRGCRRGARRRAARRSHRVPRR